MKSKIFKNQKAFFHIVFEYNLTGLFKRLDWVFIQKIINTYSSQFEIEVQALVLMDTHIHLLVQSNAEKENFFIDQLGKKLSVGEISETHCEPIENYSQYLNTYKYIYRNPVEAGMCVRCEDYEFSSLNCLLGKQATYCFYSDKLNLIQNPVRLLRWLNSNEDYIISKLKELRHANSFLT